MVGGGDRQIEDEVMWDQILHEFPGLDFAIAYGSGVFEQKGYTSGAESGAPMIDLIFATSDPIKWHKENIEKNRNHYSILATLGSSAVTTIQASYGAKIYFNTLVNLPNVGGTPRVIKYGVMSSADLCDDLRQWDTLYVSGRMHKPVRLLRNTDEVRDASHQNVRSALSAALLLLPSQFTEYDLYMKIAGLSYSGDFRMQVGENPHKVDNIVSKSLPHFRSLYTPFLKELPSVTYPLLSSPASSSSELPNEMRLEQDGGVAAKRMLIRSLPASVTASLPPGGKQQLLEGSSVGLAVALSSIVARSSRSQALKGVLTAGLGKSMRYAGEKLSKQWKAAK